MAYAKEMKRLEEKKKELAEKHRLKEGETEQLRERIREEERAKRKAELSESIKRVRERTFRRQEHAKGENEKLKELLSRK
jgi:hypothetical protein